MKSLQERWKRPKLKLAKSKSEWVWDIIGYGVYLASIIFLIYIWDTLPNEVPAHFNASGEVDRWGSKYELLILPIIGLLMAVLMQFIEKFPESHNYPSRLNENNVKEFYLLSRKMANAIKNITLFIFALMLFQSVSIALEWGNPLGKWLLPIIILSVLIPIVLGIIKQRKIR